MKIAIAQLNYHIGNFEGNLEKMKSSVAKAKLQRADIVCFGELATCGYPPRDFLEFDDFICLCEKSIESLTEMADGIAIVVGSPTRNPEKEGKDLYNSAYFLANKQVLHVQHKALLPTYDIFDEYRYFEPATEFKVLDYKGQRIALSICEDIWNVGNENPLYKICPLDEMMPQNPSLILNLSASPFSYDHAKDRIAVVKANVERYKAPLFYINHVGSQTDVVFDGGSLVVSSKGVVHDEMVYFQEDLIVYDLLEVEATLVDNEQSKHKTTLIHDALILGIQDYFKKLGFKKAILGLSGGIDSAVTAVLAARALGSDNVRVLLMPSQYSSNHSVADARNLAEKLGIQYDIIAIKPMFDAFESALAPQFTAMEENITEENIQARIRGMLLMAMTNKFGCILLNTSNKSEMAVGYGTLYGDMCGGIAVLGDIYKTEVYDLAHYINKDGEVIPQNSIVKPPSAELRPGQKDSDSLPEYDILDKILFQYIEKRKSPQDIIDQGFDEKIVKKACRLVNINEFKREQTAPVIRVSNKAFGMGRRMPIVGKYLN
ncbi:MAG: NAD+ synthase [Saprospiraceae bacterium]|nr:NAD+ synthase [Saprospiraceae bacterium]